MSSNAKLTSTLITPLDDRLLIKVIAGERMTAGGLFIPDTAQISGQKKAKVVAVGRGHVTGKGQLRMMDVQIGDEVLYSEYSGTTVEIAGEEYLFIRENDVLGIVQK